LSPEAADAGVVARRMKEPRPGGRAGERGAVLKEWKGRFSIALTYPNTYRVGMSNLGFQVVYAILNQHPDVVAERVFVPEGFDPSLPLPAGRGPLSAESGKPLRDFDLIAFSLSFENDYPQVLNLLAMAGIPLLAESRGDSEPWVVAGGVTSFLNPEPLSPFMDFFLVGEAEACLTEFLDLLLALHGRPLSRTERLRDLAQGLDCLYAPALYEARYGSDGALASFAPRAPGVRERIRVRKFTALSNSRPAVGMRTSESEWPDRSLIELGRGCARSCRFCAAGFVYRPPRFRAPAALQSAVERVLREGAEVGLLAAAVSDVPQIGSLTGAIAAAGGRFSVSSLRADGLSPDLLGHLWQTGQRTVAIAPEAGSERMRRVINKHLTEEQLVSAVRRIAEAGAFAVRLYFLIGLPGETRTDVASIVDLVKLLKHHLIRVSAPRGRVGQIRLSVNCFVPKPFTPFQWCALESVGGLKEKQKWLKRALGREGGVKVTADLPKWAYVQALLALGDRRVGTILLRHHEFRGDWPRALRCAPVNPDYFVHRPKKREELLPWDFLDHGLDRNFLWEEYELALRGTESEPCPLTECGRCGVCGFAPPGS
jgi:radical SAM superfamily enzyme YgiQ (UPF0313 family)